MICIIGKSRAGREISKATGFEKFKGQKNVECVINYGLPVSKVADIMHKYGPKIPVLNRHASRSKLSVINQLSAKGITVPESKLRLSLNDKVSDWIEKKVHSSQGIGIKKATHRESITGKYYQKMVKNRVYELRVHTFMWLPKADWTVNKRSGPANQIAWNYHMGGHFSSVRNHNVGVFLKAKDIAQKVLEELDMNFGAVDFIVDSDMNVIFIEVNSSPGFTDLNRNTYVEAMNALKKMKF